MKKIKLIMPIIASSLACTSFASMITLSSCSGKNEEDPTNPYVDVGANSRIDYVYKKSETTFKDARFTFDLHDCNANDKIKVTVSDAKSYVQGKAVNFVKVVENEFVITEGQKSITFTVELTDKTKYDFANADEYELHFQVAITHNDKTTTSKIADALWIEVAKATQASDFTTENVNGGVKITGFQGQDYETCNLFMLPDTISDKDVIEIDANAFYDTTEHQSKIPENMNFMLLDQSWGFGTPKLQTIGDSAFRAAPFMGECYIPSTVKTIGLYAFANCSFSGKFQVGTSATVDTNQLTSINKYAFQDCKFTGDCILPKGLTELGDLSFYNCPFTGDYHFPASLTRTAFQSSGGGQAFAENEKCNGKLIFDDIQNSQFAGFGYRAFYKTSIHGDLILPNSLSGHNIGSEAFSLTQITSISLPKGLANIYYRAFANSNGITKIDLTRIDDLNDNVFTGINVQSGVFAGIGEDAEGNPIKVTVLINKSLEQTLNLDNFKTLLQNKGMNITKAEFQFVQA